MEKCGPLDLKRPVREHTHDSHGRRSPVFTMLPAVVDETTRAKSKRKRGDRLTPSLTLRVSVFRRKQRNEANAYEVVEIS